MDSISICKILMFAGRVGAHDREKEVLFSLFCKCCCQTGQIDGDEELCFLRTLLYFSAMMECFWREHTGSILFYWCHFIPKVETLDLNTTGHLQTDAITGILFLDILYIFFSILSSILWLTHYALIYVCLII